MHQQANLAHFCVQITEALHHAGTNPRVVGLVSNIGCAEGVQGLAHKQELRDAVRDFRYVVYCMCIM